MRHILIYFFLITTALSVQAQEITQPNIIIFYADDLGWQDTPLNDVGEPVPWETPNMLSLAAEGANFSQAYSPAPTCAPSRAAMLSGRHPIKTTLTQVSGGKLPGLTNAQAHNKLIGPYRPLRMDEEETTIAEVLADAGYVSGHIGKWHVAGANGFPEAIHQGFDMQETSRGMHQNMGDRWTGYATDDSNDPFKVDEDGRPFDSVTEDALLFMEANKSEPFFMYMATWLVHTPIQTRDLALLTYYCDVLGVDVPTEDVDFTTGGHTNPYYGAMVGTLDWSLGKVVDYLKATDDPRHPGMKLFETSYIIFSSDNGASEMDGDEIVTDNFPLDLGKTSSKEGGIRVPLVITGPDIPVNEFDNVVNGLDFFPTILSLTGTTIDDDLFNDFDGVDLSPLLKEETIAVENADGTERTDLIWHYPNANDEKAKSGIRSGNYKLYKKYVDNSYEAYQLYNDDGSFNDVEEFINIIDVMPATEKDAMIAKLEAYLADNNAKYPTWNPDYSEPDGPLPNQEFVPGVASVTYNQDTNIATATVTDGPTDAAIAIATLLYRENTGAEDDEWFELEETTISGNIITADVPENATAIAFNMIDENNFLVLSNQLPIVTVTQIVLNDVDQEQSFNPTETYEELIGATTINGSGAYLQMRTEGGGDGAKYLVRSTNNTTVLCDKVTFSIRSQEEDIVAFDVTIAGITQSFDYTSSSTSADFDFDFDTPITYTNTNQEMEIVTTALTNTGGLVPRFRLYNLTFHLGESVAVDDVEDDSQSLDLFPNPVHNVFSLSEEVETGALYNLYGAKVYEFKNQYQNIDVSRLETGLYFLEVTFKNGGERTLKLLKE